MSARASFPEAGWLRFAPDPRVLAWAAAALPAARLAVRDPANAAWLRCGGTWFVGVDVLPNDAQGRIAGGPPLEGEVMEFIRGEPGLGGLPLHRAQVSVCYPGYPQPMAGESAAAFRFRREMDAAHVDGLLAQGPERRRFLREPHAWILGLALNTSPRGAAPLVVREGSHALMHAAFSRALADHAPHDWDAIDLTQPYQEARRAALRDCPRVVVELQPGEACLMHRQLLHGIAPWDALAGPSRDGRMIAYFRPCFPRPGDWIQRRDWLRPARGL